MTVLDITTGRRIQPVLRARRTPEARARWAYTLAVASKPPGEWVCMDQETLAHTGATMENVGALIDELVEAGGVALMGSTDGGKRRFRVVLDPPLP